jgi:hypothetical protein
VSTDSGQAQSSEDPLASPFDGADDRPPRVPRAVARGLGRGQHGVSIDIALGEAERARIGNRRWNKRVARAFHWLEEMVLFDRMYVGGGNARHLALDLGPRVEVVSNTAGITGGIRLWDHQRG